MELQDVVPVSLDKLDTVYIDRYNGECVVICSRPDDGACLIIEILEDGEPTNQYVSTEACYLEKIQ